jgi:hypothetical protein
MSKESWIYKTNQAWKIVIFGILVLVDMVFFLALLWRINFPEKEYANIWLPDEVVIALSFVGLGILTFAFIWFSIRCPACRKNVGSKVLKTSKAGVWFTTLTSLRSCPYCGNGGVRKV